VRARDVRRGDTNFKYESSTSGNGKNGKKGHCSDDSGIEIISD